MAAWEAHSGARFDNAVIEERVALLAAAVTRNDGVEWGDVRSRHIDGENRRFLTRVLALRRASAS